MNQRKGKAAALVGASAFAILLTILPNFEGTILRGYLDPVGIPTKCMGDTTGVVVGKAYTMEECIISMEEQIVAHAGPVIDCAPAIKNNPYFTASAVSFAYNIGVSAFCRSGTAKNFNSGDFKKACKYMNENDNGKPQWITSKGRVLPGLVTRRAYERKLCERGLTNG